jgi:hypothetical protein
MSQLLQGPDELLWNKIVARAWCDEGVMKRLWSEPRAVFAEHCLNVPETTLVKVLEGNEVKVLEDTDRVRYFVLPVNPPGELEDEDLIGGGEVAWCGCAACARCGCAACGRCGGCGCRCW